MNCLWLLVLLFFCGNNSGCCVQSRESKKECSCECTNNRRDRDDNCGCNSNNRRDNDDEDCGCMNPRNESRLEPRTFTSFNSSSCGCEN